MYLTYEEYQNYGGTLDETAFNDFEFEAECLINWYTFNRLKNDTEFPEEVKRCTYKLIQLAKMKADALILGNQQTITTTEVDGVVTKTTTETTAPIASQSNDGVSISYNTISAAEIFNKLNNTNNASLFYEQIKMYLNGVVNSLGQHVLYRGLQ